MLGIIEKIAQSWRKVKLEEVLVSLSNGLTAKQNKDGNGLPVTRIETITNDVIDENKVGFVDNISKSDLDKYRLYSGDILMSHINSEPQIGRSVVYEGKPEILLHGMNLLRFRVNSRILCPYYLNYLFKFYREKGIFIAMAARAVGQSSINQGKLKSLVIPLPLLSEQRAIARALRAVQEAREARRREGAMLEELSRAMLEELMTGRLSALPLVEAEGSS